MRFPRWIDMKGRDTCALLLALYFFLSLEEERGYANGQQVKWNLLLEFLNTYEEMKNSYTVVICAHVGCGYSNLFI